MYPDHLAEGYGQGAEWEAGRDVLLAGEWQLVQVLDAADVFQVSFFQPLPQEWDFLCPLEGTNYSLVL